MKPTLPPVKNPKSRVRKQRALLAQLPPVSDLPLPEEKVSGRAWIPWHQALSDYLAPIVNADGTSAAWLGLPEIAERYGCGLQAVRDKSAEEGWREKQLAAMDEWWGLRNSEINKMLAHRIASARFQAFVGGNRTINRANAILNGDPDSGTLFRAAGSLQRGLDVVMKAAGVDTPAQAAALGAGAQVNTSNSPSTSDSLWTMIMNARKAVGGADPDLIAQYEEKSTLPDYVRSAMHS